MRFGRTSITTVGAAALLLSLGAPGADAQTGRIGVLRPLRPNMGFGAPRPRLASLAPGFSNTCFVAPVAFNPFFGFGGGFPFGGFPLFANTQPAPDPSSHLTPDPNGQPVPMGSSQPLPGVQPVPGPQPVPGLQPVPTARTTSANAVPAFAAPVYSAPVYSAPVYGAATPVATPQVSNGMVVGDVIDDPTFGLWGSSFFFGVGVTCVPNRVFGRIVIW